MENTVRFFVPRFFFCAVLAIVSLPAAFGDEIVRWYDSAQKLTWGYTVNNGEATISTPDFWDSNARDNCKGDIVVPARIGPNGPGGTTTYPVRDMKPGLFRNCTKVTSVKLPDGIRRVADNAFYFDRNSIITNVIIGEGCLDICENAFLRCEKLVSLNIPNTVTNIGKDAISLCKVLPRIDIPGSVKTIGDSAFAACYDLEDVTFGDGIEIIDVDAFMNCSTLKLADLPATVRSVGDRAFYGCGALASVVLREGLEEIGFCAFNQCEKLTSVSIPSSVIWVGERAFEYCPDSIFDLETVQGVRLLSGWAVGVNNPFGVSDLFGVNGVADGLFKNQRYVTNVVLPPGMETIGNSMFSGCTSLESVGLPAALKSIGDYAFQNCEKLEFVSVPSGVTNIGQYAFAYCKKLTGAALPSGLATMGDNAFEGCEKLAEVTIPASLRRIPMAAYEWCTNLTSVTVEDGVEVIGNAAFYGCKKLPAFTIPDSVKVVENIAFGNCAFPDTNTISNVAMVDGWIVESDQQALKEVTVPGDVRGICDCAFSYRGNLTNAVVEEGVAVIPFQAFAFDAKLTDVALPVSLVEVGKQAFCGCRGLVSIYVPSNVVSIGEEAFASCTMLETVYLPITIKGKVNEADLINGSFNAKILYYRSDGTLDDQKRVTFDPNGGELAEAEASRDVKEGSAVGILPTPTWQKYKFLGWFTESGDQISASTLVEDNITYYAEWEEDLAWLSIDMAPEYETQADGSFELALEDCVESASTPKITVTGLPPGLKYDAKTLTISGKATKPGMYTVIVKVTNAKRKSPVSVTFALTVPNLSSDILPNLDPAVDAYGTVQCGVAFKSELIDCTPEEGWTVKATGLPAGLKYDAKAGAITGVPTKAGTNTVTFTASKKGEKNQIATITLVTAALPAWAQGTFTGYVMTYGGEPDYENEYGSVTMTVSANGKVSGKIALMGTNWTFSVASYVASDGGDYFEVEAEAKAGKATMPLWFQVCHETGCLPGDVLINGVVEGWLGGYDVTSVSLWRNMWKDKATATSAKGEIAKWEGVYTISVEDGGYLSLTVGKDGTVKAAGKLADGTVVSSSIPLMYHVCWDFFTFVWASPSAYNGGFVWLNEIRFGTERGRLNDGCGSMVVSSRNPQANGEYGTGFTRHLSFEGAYYDNTKKLSDYYAAMRLSMDDVPAIRYNRKVTYFDENNKKKTVTVADEASATDTLWQDGLVATVSAKGAFVVTKATKPIQDKETKDWSYEGVNDGAMTLSFAQATGIVKGTYTFWYDYLSAYDEITGKETKAHVSKKVSFEGIRVQGAEGMRGFYLWDATGAYEDPKTGKPKTYKYKESHAVSLTAQ